MNNPEYFQPQISKAIGQKTRDLFSRLFKSPSYSAQTQKYNPLPGVPESYKVKPGDTDMAAVANSLGLPLETVVSANNGAKTLPPVGSYISTGAKYNTGQQERPNPAQGRMTQEAFMNQFPGQGTVDRTTSGVNIPRPQNIPSPLAAQQMLNSNMNVPVFPQSGVGAVKLADGRVVTEAMLLQFGYVKDYTRNVWIDQSQSATGVGGATTAAPVISSSNYGYGTSGDGRPLDSKGIPIGAARNAKGTLIKRRKEQPVLGDGTTESGGTTLELRLGSG